VVTIGILLILSLIAGLNRFALLLQRPLLRLKVYFKRGDILFSIDSPLQKLHRRKELVNFLAKFLLFHHYLVTVYYDSWTRADGRRLLSTTMGTCGHLLHGVVCYSWSRSSSLLGLQLLGLHLIPIIVDPHVFELKLENLGLVF